MTKDNEQYAYFTIAGDFDPEWITAQLGLIPSKSWKKGDLNERTRMERKSSRWSLYSRLDHSLSLEEHVNDVLGQVSDKASEIRAVGQIYTVLIQLVGYFHNVYPGFGLERAAITEMARLNVGIDCDFYYLYSDTREDS